MRDLRDDLSSLWRKVATLEARSGAPTLGFVAAKSGEGTTSVATSFAMMAASRVARSAWLVDLDLHNNNAYKGLSERRISGFSSIGRAFDASLGTPQIYDVTPPIGAPIEGRGAPMRKLLAVHPAEGSRLLVTRFRNERLQPGQRVSLRSQPEWWDALRKVTDWVVVDMPALERSSGALTAVNQMDGVVLVVSADKTTSDEIEALQQEVESYGGQVLGVVLNHHKNDARLLERLIP